MVSRGGTAMALPAPPVHRRMVPSRPPAKTDVGLAAHTASSETSVSPCPSRPHVFTGLWPRTTVSMDVALDEPMLAVISAFPLETAVTTPDADTLAFDALETLHFGLRPSTTVPSALRPKNWSGAVDPTSRYSVAG